MLPLRDSIPSVSRPYAAYAIILLNLLVFLLEQGLSGQVMENIFYIFGVVPRRFFQPEWADAVGFPPGGHYAFVTHMFLHSGWLHFLMNMWTMWIFADNVEDVMGHGRFLAFYLLSGFGALAAHIVFNQGSQAPIVGASGAIAGVMGAYFVLYPHARVVTLIPIFIFPYIVDLPAVLFLGIWFATQVLSGVTDIAASGGAGIAWWAHVGGFLAGILLLPVFRRADACKYCYNRKTKNYEPADSESDRQRD